MLSKRAMHALDLVVTIASNSVRQPVTTNTLSRYMDLSVSYIESILKELRQAGLVKSCRGPGGGYLVAKDIAELSAWDVLMPFAGNAMRRRYPNSSPAALAMDVLEREYLDTMAKALEACSVSSLQMSAFPSTLSHHHHHD